MNEERKFKPKKERLTDVEMFCVDAYIINGDLDMAYRLSRPRRQEKEESESFHRLAVRWRNNDLVKSYIAERSGAINVKQEDVETGQYRTKENVLDALEREVPYLRGKDRLDALMKIADLQQLKREEQKPEEDRVHFYLPLPICKDCPNKERLIRKTE